VTQDAVDAIQKLVGKLVAPAGPPGVGPARDGRKLSPLLDYLLGGR
jgi:hypothetical protein